MAKFGGGIANLVLSGISFLFGILILGFSGYLTHVGNDGEANQTGGYPIGTARYMVFVAVWTLVFTIILPFTSMSSAKMLGFVNIAIASLTVLFLFAGWVALAAQAHSFTLLHGGFVVNTGDVSQSAGQNSYDYNPYRVAAADAAFGAFEWAIWIGIAVTSGLSSRNRV